MKSFPFSESFEIIRIFGRRALFAETRVDRETRPNSAFIYDLLSEPEGRSITLEYHGEDCYAGTVIMKRPLDLCDVDTAFINHNDLVFTGEQSTFKQFIDAHDPMPKYKLRSVSPEEESFFFNSDEANYYELGCVGLLRGDFGINGREFWTTWFEHCEELKTQAFKYDLDFVINSLRKNGILKNLDSMTAYLHARPDAKLDLKIRDDIYGVKIVTRHYCYYLRGLLSQNDYNFYVMCYQRDRLHDYLTSKKQYDSLKDTSCKKQHRRNFIAGARYFSDDKYEMVVCKRTKNGIRAEVGLAMPANYKVTVDATGCEQVNAKGHIFRAV